MNITVTRDDIEMTSDDIKAVFRDFYEGALIAGMSPAAARKAAEDETQSLIWDMEDLAAEKEHEAHLEAMGW